MKTRSALTAIFASLATVLVGWQFSTVTSAPNTQLSSPDGSPTNPLAPPNSPVSPSTTTSNSSSTSGLRDGTVTGHSVNTRYGAVQVKVTVVSGSISDVAAVRLTDQGGESVQISNYAAPILRSEVLKSQSAKVSNVSGATYTTEGYLSSLQSALDQMAK